MFAAEHCKRRTRWSEVEQLIRRVGLAGALLSVATTLASDDAGGIVDAPLAAHAHPQGKTMFVQLPSDQTGVRTENRYADPKMWGELYQESESGSLGTGVTIGDYDAEGKPDIFVVSKTESCRLFRN